MRRYSRALIVAVAVAVWPSIAAAQSQFTGLVSDESGGALPGVTVEISRARRHGARTIRPHPVELRRGRRQLQLTAEALGPSR